jgi:hypothetical protein
MHFFIWSFLDRMNEDDLFTIVKKTDASVSRQEVEFIFDRLLLSSEDYTWVLVKRVLI